ncbi:hypothetical protein GCM10007876_11320 [Litoribrevibacter albus]|uniref:Uncharacterized protein n=1 Tax=Litoribrevibacter albus TaxID=1473156 RepID=A0AA37S908_9GAMM|nr:hypothetical protein GCM10007876_11320 [Litoribrevibacter albus]
MPEGLAFIAEPKLEQPVTVIMARRTSAIRICLIMAMAPISQPVILVMRKIITNFVITPLAINWLTVHISEKRG